MDDFAKKPLEERKVLIQQAALATNLNETIIEKDFWVCWLLHKIFSLLGISEHLIFKGGRSLSKAYGLLRRFSEDIHISIDRALIGFAGDKDPLAATSRTARERRLEELQAACVTTISSQVLPAIEALVSRDLKEKNSLSIDPESKGFPERLSRHFYDLHILMRHPTGAKAAQNLELLERVVKHKQVFFRSSWANYDAAKPGGLRLLPTTAQEAVLRSDYARMREMFFDEPPSFDEILMSLEKLEEQLNKGT